MKKNRKKCMRILLLVFLAFSLSLFTLNQSQAYSDVSEYVILFDESHGQFFTYTNMKTAYDLLNDSGDFEVRRLTSNQNLTSNNLTDVEILVISAPENDSVSYYTETELLVIRDFVFQGGSLFLLNNPNDSRIYTEFNYTNTNYTFMNDILDKLSMSTVRFTNEAIEAPASGGYYYVKNRYQLPLDEKYLNSLSTISLGIMDVLVFSTAINCSDPSLVIGRTFSGSDTYPSSLANPYWLIAKDFQTSGRVVACGSMQMFSEIQPFNLSSKWITPNHDGLQFQNSKLWINIFSWLSQENNSTIASTVFLIISVGLIGLCAFLIHKNRGKEPSVIIVEEKEEATSKEKKSVKTDDVQNIDELIHQRANVLKSARFFIKNRNFIKASQFYKKAADLTTLINDDENLFNVYMKKSKKYGNNK